MPSNIIGVFIGIGTYFTNTGNVDEDKSLFSSPNDAILLSKAFKQIPISKDILTLTDSEYSQLRPTRNQIFALIKSAIESSTDDSHFIFYFAGHGFSLGKDFFLHPCDFDERIPHLSGINLNDIIEQLYPIKNNKLIICDCCRINLEDIDLDKTKPFTGLPPLLIDEKTYIITSCSYGQNSYESLALETNGAGVFTHFFVKHLKKYISKENIQSVSLYKIFHQTKISTSKYLTENHEILQVPAINGGDANDWILIGDKTLL